MSQSILPPPDDIAREAAAILLDTQSVLVRPSEPFTFTSGKRSPVYVDCRRLISFPRERTKLMEFAQKLLSERIGAADIDLLAGGETAGIPYAAFLAGIMDKPMAYIRKKPKGFGAMSQIEGHFPKEDPNVILIEDLQSEGTSKEVFVNALRNAGAKISDVFVIFHYGIFESSPKAMEDMNVRLHSLTSWWDIVALIEDEKRMSPEDIAQVKMFLNDPEAWRKEDAARASA